MAKKPINLRIDPQLWEQVQQRAKSEGKTTTEFVEEALRRAYLVGKAVVHIENPRETPEGKIVITAPDADEIATRDTVEHYYRCPVAACTFSAPSPKARCGVHGRTVV